MPQLPKNARIKATINVTLMLFVLCTVLMQPCGLLKHLQVFADSGSAVASGSLLCVIKPSVCGDPSGLSLNQSLKSHLAVVLAHRSTPLLALRNGPAH